VLLKEDADANAMSQLYSTPLLVAALKGHANIVQLLMEPGTWKDQHSGIEGKA
jgi:ankyrin repeat protein